MAERYVVVTGAAGALGHKVADVLQANGAKVIAVDQAPTIAGEGFALSFAGTDLCDQESVNAAFATIGRELGDVHGLVNIAGGFAWETLEDGDLSTWDRMYDMNLKTAVVTTRAALRLCKAGASIVNVSAAASVKSGPGMGAYAASKAGVSRLTESLAAELKDRGIRVNAVLPSIIDTPANRRDMASEDFSRWVTPAELADVIDFLLSEKSRAITGALLPVTGRT